MNLSVLSQPSFKGSRVPPGHILVHSKYQGNEIIKLIQASGIKPVVQEGLGIVDFYPSNSAAVLWLSENKLIEDEIINQRKVTVFSKGLTNAFVCAHVTDLSHQYFKKLQLFLLKSDCNVSLVPVKSVNEMIKFTAQLVYNECTSIHDCKSMADASLDEMVLCTLQAFPAVGEKKAKELLSKLPSIFDVGNSTMHHMEDIVGHSTTIAINGLLSPP